MARSSAEAEYRAMAATVFELLWLSYVIKNLNISINYFIKLFCDNQETIQILENRVLQERSKHIYADCHFIMTHYTNGFVKLVHLISAYQIVNLFTKAVGANAFISLLGELKLEIFQAQLKGCV